MERNVPDRLQKETVRYVYEDPETKETVDDFADNKVNDKYLMAIRRNVTLPGRRQLRNNPFGRQAE